ncbi:peroxiredoxin-5, mitochondrial-like [Colletes latitarsis]|uniref:peroxiredoxin-5, mitochondrial-like n=1 Tax=Colletes latitarsis TaxID=2605962 RepID=UPI004034FDBE
MTAWDKKHGAEEKEPMLVDPVTQFTNALELSVDLPVLGGERSKRCSMVLQDDTVKESNI